MTCHCRFLRYLLIPACSELETVKKERRDYYGARSNARADELLVDLEHGGIDEHNLADP
jgi:hypothetical protein